MKMKANEQVAINIVSK